MSASAFPEPPSKTSGRNGKAKKSAESDIDAVMEKIDRALPRVVERAKMTPAAGTPLPGYGKETRVFDPKNCKRTQQAFRALSESDLDDDLLASKDDEEAVA